MLKGVSIAPFLCRVKLDSRLRGTRRATYLRNDAFGVRGLCPLNPQDCG